MTINAAVLIGRFQPFHSGHLSLLRKTLSKYEQVVVTLGSHNSLRTLTNPWTASEREEMIEGALSLVELRKLKFHWQEDRPGHNEQWSGEIKKSVESRIWHFDETPKIHLAGYYKDETSYYLQFFKEWTLALESNALLNINATDIRRSFFSGQNDYTWQSKVPISTYKLMKHFQATNLFKELSRTALNLG